MTENGQSKSKISNQQDFIHVLKGVIQIPAAMKQGNVANVLLAIIWETVINAKRDVYKMIQVLSCCLVMAIDVSHVSSTLASPTSKRNKLRIRLVQPSLHILSVLHIFLLLIIIVSFVFHFELFQRRRM